MIKNRRFEGIGKVKDKTSLFDGFITRDEFLKNNPTLYREVVLLLDRHADRSTLFRVLNSLMAASRNGTLFYSDLVEVLCALQDFLRSRKWAESEFLRWMRDNRAMGARYPRHYHPLWQKLEHLSAEVEPRTRPWCPGFSRR